MFSEIWLWLIYLAGAAGLGGITYFLLKHLKPVPKVLISVGVGLVAFLLFEWLGWQYRHWMDLSITLKVEERIRAEIEAVKTVAQVLGGLLLFCGIFLTVWRIRTLERQVEVAQEEQVTERFTRAIEQLGSDKMEVRLGGIYALERIAKDSDKDYWTIMEVLTAFIRENAPWPSKEGLPHPLTDEGVSAEMTGEVSGETGASGSPLTHKPRTDIQAALTVLGRRGRRQDKSRLDLKNTDLRGADLRETHLAGAILMDAHLEGADLGGAHLEGAHLRGAHLSMANLRGAHMKGAILWEAHLEGANLLEARLEGADLLGATGLIWEQLDGAILDENTELPDYLPPRPAAPPADKGEDTLPPTAQPAPGPTGPDEIK